jgi:ABC-type dipeptide/oligopeptide/nickel transport system permease subunit
MPLWLQITVAIALGIMVIRLWPVAGNMLKNGPKGSSDDWRAALFPILMVVGFVILLVLMVRG